MNQWTFGTNHILTLIGFAITIGIAIGGFRTFERWKREKIEERRIDIALEALSLAYEAQGVFDTIRNPGAFSYEWEDMPEVEGESRQDRDYKKTYYVILKRLDNQRDFFLRVLKLQPQFMAVFGPETEEIFKELNWARVHVQVSAQSLMRPERGEWTSERQKRRTQMEADVWTGLGDVHSQEELPEGDRVKKRLDAFKERIVKVCRPIVDREFKESRSA
jgi:hypothetical protein